MRFNILLAITAVLYFSSLLTSPRVTHLSSGDLKNTIQQIQELSSTSTLNASDFSSAFNAAIKSLRASAGMQVVIVGSSVRDTNNPSLIIIPFKHPHIAASPGYPEVLYNKYLSFFSYISHYRSLDIPPPVPPPLLTASAIHYIPVYS